MGAERKKPTRVARSFGQETAPAPKPDGCREGKANQGGAQLWPRTSASPHQPSRHQPAPDQQSISFPRLEVLVEVVLVELEVVHADDVEWPIFVHYFCMKP